jgi:hypothetical protein
MTAGSTAPFLRRAPSRLGERRATAVTPPAFVVIEAVCSTLADVRVITLRTGGNGPPSVSGV